MSAELREGQLEYVTRRFPTEGCIFRFEEPIVQVPERIEIETILKAIPIQLEKPQISLDNIPEEPFVDSVPGVPLVPLGHTFNSLFRLRQKQLWKATNLRYGGKN